jgi:hypothetical protein
MEVSNKISLGLHRLYPNGNEVISWFCVPILRGYTSGSYFSGRTVLIIASFSVIDTRSEGSGAQFILLEKVKVNHI